MADMKEANMQKSSNLINLTNESLINGRLGKKNVGNFTT